MNKVNGLLYGLLSSASFGLIPLFTIPAMQAGMQFESILFYRFLFACLALGGILLVNGQSFRIKRQDIPSLFLLALLYLMSAVFLFWGYKFMASGVATTIHFMYPVLTTLIMMLFFKEKKSGWRIAAIASAVAGVYFLSGQSENHSISSFIGCFVIEFPKQRTCSGSLTLCGCWQAINNPPQIAANSIFFILLYFFIVITRLIFRNGWFSFKPGYHF